MTKVTLPGNLFERIPSSSTRYPVTVPNPFSLPSTVPLWMLPQDDLDLQLLFQSVDLSACLSIVLAAGRSGRGSLELPLTGGAGGRSWKTQRSRGHAGPTNRMKPPSRGEANRRFHPSAAAAMAARVPGNSNPADGKHVCDKCDVLKKRATATQTRPYGGGHTNTAWVGWGGLTLMGHGR